MSQDWTDDCFAAGHAAQEDMQNMENNFACLKSSFSGASAPANPVGGMYWLDTTSHLLKLRNEVNNAWLTLYDLANNRAVDAAACSGITLTAGAGMSAIGALNASRTVGIAPGGVGTTQLADGAVTAQKLGAYTAGDYVEVSKQVDTFFFYGTTPGKIWSARIPRGGTVRVRWQAKCGLASQYVYTRVYKNGSAVGSQHTVHSASYADNYEDVAVNAGDELAIYGSSNNVDYEHPHMIKFASICTGTPLVASKTWADMVSDSV